MRQRGQEKSKTTDQEDFNNKLLSFQSHPFDTMGQVANPLLETVF